MFFLTLSASLASVDLVLQVFKCLEVNDSPVRNCIVVSILKFTHVGGGTVCERMKSGEVLESAVESVLDVNVSAAVCLGVVSLNMAARYGERNVGVNTLSCLRPSVTGNGFERTPRWFTRSSIPS